MSSYYLKIRQKSINSRLSKLNTGQKMILSELILCEFIRNQDLLKNKNQND